MVASISGVIPKLPKSSRPSGVDPMVVTISRKVVSPDFRREAALREIERGREEEMEGTGESLKSTG